MAIDMPTMWTHNITNSGDQVLYTSFWTNDIFDPDQSRHHRREGLTWLDA